jgi:hypothetical protein
MCKYRTKRKGIQGIIFQRYLNQWGLLLLEPDKPSSEIGPKTVKESRLIDFFFDESSGKGYFNSVNREQLLPFSKPASFWDRV